MKKLLPIFLFLAIVLFFFRQFFFNGLLPIPSDTIVGLYHPFRDLYVADFPNGIPFKNFLITDPVRQTYVWKELAYSMLKSGYLPLWNPYSFSGVPLLAAFQAGVFYPINLIFFIFPFWLGWSFYIILQPVLAGIFLYLYLDNLKLKKQASFLGALVFSFSGFSVSWLLWGNVIHTALWLPLILLSIDKLISAKRRKEIFLWSFIYIFSITSSFFAGYLQAFFYLSIFSFAYFLARWFLLGKTQKILFIYVFLNVLLIIITSAQWIPTLEFINLSARNLDQVNWANMEGWFMPWQHLLQFIAPDFFGNPTTLNYWGTWNYGELVGYIGILPLTFALFAIFSRRDKKTVFFGVFFFLSLIFALPTFLAKMPFILEIPFIKTSQPTRLLFIIDFSLSVLAALGFDYFIRNKKKSIYSPLIFMLVIVIFSFGFAYFGDKIQKNVSLENLTIIKRNLIFPLSLITASFVLVSLSVFFKKSKKIYFIYITIIVFVVFDLFRFGWKFTPFTQKEYLFPSTKTTDFIKSQKGEFRIMSFDSRILPPNFSDYYRIQSVEGYDPLYLKNYAELIIASERGKPDISPPFGFNRIITPHNIDSKILNLLGVRYILSLSDITSPNLNKVFQEGQTQIYENKDYLPRAFFVESVKIVKDKKQAIDLMFSRDFFPEKTAIVEEDNLSLDKLAIGNVKITRYSANKIEIVTESSGKGFMVLTDTFYPSWKAEIDGKPTEIFKTNYNFRGIIVPMGSHSIIFYNSLF